MIARAAAAVGALVFTGAGPAPGQTLEQTLEQRICRYDVEVSRRVELDVAVRCDGDVYDLRPLDRYSHGHVNIFAAARDADGFSARYRVTLGDLARDASTLDAAVVSGESILAVASAWLLNPMRETRAPATLEIRVTTPPEIDFATAQPVSDGAFRIPQSELAMAGYAAFGRFVREPMRAPQFGVGGDPGGYEVVLLDGRLNVPQSTLLEWIAHCADAITRFWHGFPAPGMKIFVLPRAGAEGVVFGRDMSGGGISMVLVVGERATRAQLYDDWVLIHELVHVGSPFVAGAPWFTEGLATYLEPLIRARYGLQTADAMWVEFITNMPRGAAVIDATGLMRGGFRGWYWGGGLLMLLADVEMRRASEGRIGIEDCLRDIRRVIGNYLRSVRLAEMVAACDAAVGGTVLADLVERHAYSDVPVDLDGLWRDLGVRLVDGELEIDGDARLAMVREAIVRGGPAAADARAARTYSALHGQ